MSSSNYTMARVPKQKELTKSESITTFEQWRQNLIFTLSLDSSFSPYLAENYQLTGKVSKNKQANISHNLEGIRWRLSPLYRPIQILNPEKASAVTCHS